VRKEGEDEFRTLLDFFTVKETYFYRFESQFKSFQNCLLPQFVQNPLNSGRKFRVWSAGCCTGEEPYTIALLAAEAGWADYVEILATDINDGYLQEAMLGVYSERSVENLPKAILERYFSKKGTKFALSPEIINRVVFRHLNLIENTYPSFLNQTYDLDLILCRNVLIYFEKALSEEIVNRFDACLRDGGLIALGHSEALRPELGFPLREIDEGFFYEKRPRKKSEISNRASQLENLTPKPPFSKKPLERPPESEESLLEKAETLANQGSESEAVKLCKELLQKYPLSDAGYYLLGLLEIADPKVSLAHFNQAIYLNPEHLLARFQAAGCLDRLGQRKKAIQEYGGIGKIASKHQPDQMINTKEGITFGMLRLFCERALSEGKAKIRGTDGNKQ
jgi:chemotaxis protein methyltransferase CheR